MGLESKFGLDGNSLWNILEEKKKTDSTSNDFDKYISELRFL